MCQPSQSGDGPPSGLTAMPSAGPADLPSAAPSSVTEAVAAVEAGLAFLATADAASLPAETLTACVRALSTAESPYVAARSRFLSAFNSQDASVADGHPTTKSWLRWQTRVTSGAAGAEVGWMRRLVAHPRVAAALAAQAISVSWARQICDWTDKLPAEFRDDADEILLAAAAGGADLADLSGLAREIYERTAPPEPDDGPPGEDPAFRDRWLRLDMLYRGEGRLEAALTPECAAAVLGMLESLGKKAGPGDDRSQGQRYHDALEEACRMLLGTGSLPDVAGQPAQMLVHATLGQLLGLAGDGDPGSGPGGEDPAIGDGGEPGWLGPDAGDDSQARAGLPGAVPDAFLSGRAAGDAEPGWLATPAAAQAYACDAKIATVITGHIDPAAVAAAVRVCLAGQDPAADAGASFDRLRAILLRCATAMLSGPAGLAAALRAGHPGPVGAGVSLPLDITSPDGDDPAAPAASGHRPGPALRLPRLPPAARPLPGPPRDPPLPGRAHLPDQPGPLVFLPPPDPDPPARLGLVLNADGTTTATSPDRRKTWHSHAPPDSQAA